MSLASSTSKSPSTPTTHKSSFFSYQDNKPFDHVSQLSVATQREQMKRLVREAGDILVQLDPKVNNKAPKWGKRRGPKTWQQWVTMACRIYGAIQAEQISQELINKMVEVIKRRESMTAWLVREKPWQVNRNKDHVFFTQQMEVVLIVLRSARSKSEGYNLV